jgi:hypothetical protein
MVHVRARSGQQKQVPQLTSRQRVALLPQFSPAIRMEGAGIFLSGGCFGWLGGFCVSFSCWRFSETLLNVYYPNNRHR